MLKSKIYEFVREVEVMVFKGPFMVENKSVQSSAKYSRAER